MIYYYSSKTKNTEKFVKKINHPSRLITKGLLVDHPFVLVLPTYARADGSGAIHKTVIDFLNQNHSCLAAVIGGGHRNFGKFFAHGATLISKKCSVPILHKFELFGTDEDVYLTEIKLKELSLCI